MSRANSRWTDEEDERLARLVLKHQPALRTKKATAEYIHTLDVRVVYRFRPVLTRPQPSRSAGAYLARFRNPTHLAAVERVRRLTEQGEETSSPSPRTRPKTKPTKPVDELDRLLEDAARRTDGLVNTTDVLRLPSALQRAGCTASDLLKLCEAEATLLLLVCGLQRHQAARLALNLPLVPHKPSWTRLSFSSLDRFLVALHPALKGAADKLVDRLDRLHSLDYYIEEDVVDLCREVGELTALQRVLLAYRLLPAWREVRRQG
jgi:hypothetical protein